MQGYVEENPKKPPSKKNPPSKTSKDLEPPSLNDLDITINWIRHAESCANKASKEGSIKALSSKVSSTVSSTLSSAVSSIFGFENLFDLEEGNLDTSNKSFFDTIASTALAPWFYEPNLTYIGMNEAINLGTEFFSNPPHNNPRNIYISSALTRTITTALLALRSNINAVIYVVPYINEIENNSSMDNQNKAVPSKLLKRKIKFIKDWLQENWIIRFDDIEIINFLTTISEMLDTNTDFSVDYPHEIHRNYPQALKSKIDSVLECIKDRDRNRNCHIIHDIQNLVEEIITCDEIKDKTYLIFKEGNTPAKLEVIANTIEKFNFLLADNRKNLRGPIVDFTFYEHYEKLYENMLHIPMEHLNTYPDTKVSKYAYFLAHVLPEILQILNYNGNDSIYAFAHGQIIRNMWKEYNPEKYAIQSHRLHNMKNTTVIQNNIKTSAFNIIHEPHQPSISDNYPFLESKNNNVCRLQSIKGVINYPLDGRANPNVNETNNPDEDVNFFYKRPYNLDVVAPSQIAGYKQKYLKYKKKYLNLKNT